MKNIRKLKAVQRRATKRIPSFYNLTDSKNLIYPAYFIIEPVENGSDYDLQNPEQFSICGQRLFFYC